MVDLQNIKSFTVERPEGWTLLGNGKAFDALPASYKDQILFLDPVASRYISELLFSANLVTGGGWDPFAKGNFKTIETFDQFFQDQESRQLLKKWLYNRGLAFDTWVFILEESNKQVLLITWKMVIKFSAALFIMSNVVVFDSTLNWCLFYYHEDKLFFGKDTFYDPSENAKRMEELNERKKNYPHFKHPFL